MQHFADEKPCLYMVYFQVQNKSYLHTICNTETFRFDGIKVSKAIRKCAMR